MKVVRAAVFAGAAAGALAAGTILIKRAGVTKRNSSLRRGQNIVIIGAGFAGLNVAQELSRLLPEEHDGNIRLVDRNNFLLFTPMLTEVAGGELDARHIVAPPRQLSPRISFEQGRVVEISLADRSVVIEGELQGGPRRTLTADHLVIAAGSVPDYHNVPGLRDHSFSMKSIADAMAVRDQIFKCLEQARWETDAQKRREILTFVVGGGGYTGVETMAALNDLARGSLRDYPGLSAEEITTIIIEPGDRLLREITPDLADYAKEKLEQRGVRILLKTKISSAGPDFVEIEGGERIPARTIVWAGGIRANPLVSQLDCAHGHRGTIVVDSFLGVPGHSGVWALGDCAQVPKPSSKSSYAPTAQNATREGLLVARNIVAQMRGEKPEQFAFEPLGELALTGRHSGVARVYGHNFSGFPAWAMWRAVYLSKMPGMAQRARILVDWILDLVFGRNISEMPIIGPVE